MAVELKAGGIDAEVVVEQLRNGAILAERLLEVGRPARFHAVLAHAQRLHPREVRVLRQGRVRFMGRAYPIEPRPCGFGLDDLGP